MLVLEDHDAQDLSHEPFGVALFPLNRPCVRRGVLNERIFPFAKSSFLGLFYSVRRVQSESEGTHV